MIHLRERDNIYMDASLTGFAKQLKNDGVINRQVDLLLIGVAYAIRNGLAPVDSLNRHPLIRVANLHPDTRLGLEASLTWYSREQGLPTPQSESELLDLLARAGSAGLFELRDEWKSLRPSQLRFRLLMLAKSRSLEASNQR